MNEQFFQDLLYTYLAKKSNKKERALPRDRSFPDNLRNFGILFFTAMFLAAIAHDMRALGLFDLSLLILLIACIIGVLAFLGFDHSPISACFFLLGIAAGAW